MPLKTPRPDQIADLAFFINNPMGGLLHDPGVGKTITAAAYSEYCYRHLGWKVLWTQPKSLIKKNYLELLDCTSFERDEIIMVRGTPKQRQELLASPKGKIFLMTPNTWSSEYETILKAQPEIKCTIHDEIHLYYVTHKSVRTQNWYLASRRMNSVIPMSGTLIKGRLNSVYPTLHVIAPQFYGSYEAFMAQHACRDDYGTQVGWQNHEKLRNVLGAVSIRRSFKSIYGDSAPVIQVENVEMHPLQREKYDELAEMATLELEDRFLEVNTAGVMAIRCRQILAHPERVKLPIAYNKDGKPTAYKDYNLLGKDIMTGKDEAMMVHAESMYEEGERLVIFSALQPEQERIYMLLKDKGYRVGLINGNVSEKDRVRIDEQFRAHELDFVVGSAQTMGVGFNWNFLKMVLFVSLDYGDDTFSQAYKRGIRGHRDQALLVKVLMYERSIDYRIFQIVQRKSEDNHQVDETKDVIFLTNEAMAAKKGVIPTTAKGVALPMKDGRLSMK